MLTNIIKQKTLIDRQIELSRGRDDKVKTLYKFGQASIGTTEQAVMKMSVPRKRPYQFDITTARPLRVKAGSNLNDSLLGSGARTIKVFGLDQTYNPIDEIIEMPEVAASAQTSQSFLRVFRALVLTSGADLQNDGDIIIENIDSVEMCIIPAQLSQTEIMIYTTRRDVVGLITQFRVFVDSTKSVNIRLWYIERGTNTQRCLGIYYAVSGVFVVDFNGILLNIDEQSDLWLTAQLSSATSDANVSASGEMYLVRKG